MEPPTQSTDEPASKPGLSRRRVLRAAGTTAAFGVAVVGGAGTAAASDEATEPPVFCGCSQVCACGTGDAGVLVAVEDGDSFEFEWFGDQEFNFCFSIDDPGVPDDGKIIAVQVGGTRWINPGQCAKKALAAEQEELDSTHPRPEGETGGPCGKPPCEHPGGGPPSDNGPPSKDDSPSKGGPPSNGGPPSRGGPPSNGGPP